jgi:hypothetical protein
MLDLSPPCNLTRQQPTPMGAPASGTPYLVPATNIILSFKTPIKQPHVVVHTCRVLVGRYEGERSSERSRCGWQQSIEMISK